MKRIENNMARPLSDVEKQAIGVHFEETCAAFKHSKCPCCRRVAIGLKIGSAGKCNRCVSFQDVNYYVIKKALPIWFDQDGEPQYHVPKELTGLSLAEMMLIQRASPFVPLRYIKNGVFGISGHVCTFEQDIKGWVDTLPRHKTDVTMISVLKTVQTEIGNDAATQTTAYKVNKEKIEVALVWLKLHNILYGSITIDMSALNWITEKEGSLESLLIEPEEDIETQHDNLLDNNTDLGPIPVSGLHENFNGENIRDFGYIDESGQGNVPPEDQQITCELQEAVRTAKQKEKICVRWPTRDLKPLSEFGPAKIFAMAYPWLFPGGIGDVRDYPGSPKEWGEHMLLYEDGRFTKDKFFTFFAMNYVARNRNNSSGGWFVKEFNKGGPANLSELKQTISDGDTRFVNSLTYYSKCVKGSTAYWHQKRSELYTWINHHVEMGDGPPTMFITLSCGEYYWPDVIALLKERMEMAGDDSSECFQGSSKLSSILNDYAIVVQEYFQARVEAWFATVGKHILKIKHSWCRYEFAPGRGQIHAHILAIPFDHDIYKLCHADLQEENGEEKRAERLGQWAKDTMGMTACVEPGFDTIQANPEFSPTARRMTDINTTESDFLEDRQELMKFCQVHICSGFCMRAKNGKK